MWFISVVHMDSHPGTTRDVDFYSAVSDPNEDDSEPPTSNWICSIPGRGVLPAPEVRTRMYDERERDAGMI